MITFIFPKLNPFTIQWTLLDAAGDPIVDATVIATLFSGRSAQIPEIQPGTAVEEFEDVELAYVEDSAGLYEAEISAAFDAVAGGDYIVVIDALQDDEVLGHWEVPALVQIPTG